MPRAPAPCGSCRRGAQGIPPTAFERIRNRTERRGRNDIGQRDALTPKITEPLFQPFDLVLLKVGPISRRGLVAPLARRDSRTRGAVGTIGTTRKNSCQPARTTTAAASLHADPRRLPTGLEVTVSRDRPIWCSDSSGYAIHMPISVPAQRSSVVAIAWMIDSGTRWRARCRSRPASRGPRRVPGAGGGPAAGPASPREPISSRRPTDLGERGRRGPPGSEGPGGACRAARPLAAPATPGDWFPHARLSYGNYPESGVDLPQVIRIGRDNSLILIPGVQRHMDIDNVRAPAAPAQQTDRSRRTHRPAETPAPKNRRAAGRLAPAGVPRARPEPPPRREHPRRFRHPPLGEAEHAPWCRRARARAAPPCPESDR